MTKDMFWHRDRQRRESTSEILVTASTCIARRSSKFKTCCLTAFVKYCPMQCSRLL